MIAPSPRRLIAATVLVALSLAARIAAAHHSGAMFDSARTVTLQGTVRAFQWTNPHSFIQLMVDGPKGAQEWSIEMGSPSQLYRSGWRPSSIRVGERLTVVINPLRDGTQGGVFVSATAADGQTVGAPRTSGASK